MGSGVIKSDSAEHTHAIGRRLSAILASGDVVCLYGDLGTGKTCLVQGLAEGLGAEDRAVSPSFTLVNEYPGRLPLYHFDCYRLKGAGDLDQIGYDEYLGMEGVVAIEWAERIAERLPDERLDVRLERVSDNDRRITLEPHGRRWEELLTRNSLLSDITFNGETKTLPSAFVKTAADRSREGGRGLGHK